MIYCDRCAATLEWPRTLLRSRRRCQMCGEVDSCSDMNNPIHHKKKADAHGT